MSSGELALKVLRSVEERHGGLTFEGRAAGDPLDLVGLEEAEAPALSSFLRLGYPHLLQ